MTSEPLLIVIGLNHKSAPVEVRERFWVDEARSYEVLQVLARSKGVEEAIILPTCNRTEFILWASDFSSAASSVLHLLVREFGLKLCEWRYFYRLIGDEALEHVFRVAASLDSMIVGEPEITGQVKSAWARAQHAGTAGRYLDAVLQKAMSVAKRVRTETAIGVAAVSVPYAAVELAKQIFGSLENRKVMVVGAGRMGEQSARYLLNHGASTLWVTNRTFETAARVAEELHGIAVPYEDRWKYLAEADIVISSTGSPQVILDRADAEQIRRARSGQPIFLIDIAVPRNVDPKVREVPGVFLYDIDDLEQVVARNLSERQAAAAEAGRLVAAEAAAFRKKLAAERVVPTIVAVRERLEQIRQQELQRFLTEAGPLDAATEKALEELSIRIVQRVSNQLARELKQAPELREQDRLTAALRQLFHLSRSHTALTPSS
jgi:glutamyl-tRNA reductase